MKSATMLNIALCAAMFSMGYSLRCANIVLASADSNDTTFQTASTARWMTTSLQAGSFLGALSTWPLSIFSGRKPLLMSAVVVAMIGGILGAASDRMHQLAVAYGLTGLSSGVTFVVANLWMVENSPANARGHRVILINLAVCTGSAISEWVNFGVTMARASSRIPFSLQFVFQIPSLVLLYLASESYRWLLNHNQPDKARSILTALGQNHRMKESTHSTSATYFDVLIQHQRSCSNAPVRCCGCFTSRHRTTQPAVSSPTTKLHLHFLRRILLIFGIQLIPVFCGIFTAEFYLSRSFIRIRTQTLTYRIITALLSTFDIVFQLPTYLLISRFGIRKLLLASTLGLALCFVMLAPLATLQTGSFTSSISRSSDSSSSLNSDNDNNDDDALSAALLSFTLLLYVSYNIGLNSIPWLLQSELTPSLPQPQQQQHHQHHQQHQHLSTSLPALATAFRHALETAMLYANAAGLALGASYLLVWLFLNLAFAAVIWALYPETQGRTLEDLDRYFARRPRLVVGLDAVAKRVYTPHHDDDECYGGGGGGGKTGEAAQEMSSTMSLGGQQYWFKTTAAGAAGAATDDDDHDDGS